MAYNYIFWGVFLSFWEKAKTWEMVKDHIFLSLSFVHGDGDVMWCEVERGRLRYTVIGTGAALSCTSHWRPAYTQLYFYMVVTSLKHMVGIWQAEVASFWRPTYLKMYYFDQIVLL